MMEILPSKNGQRPTEILYIGFNQDQSCFVCGTENGFRVYNSDPFRLTFRREFEGGGGLCVVSMLFRCNILALVGGGTNPRFQPHKVMIWDDKTPRCIAELSFRSQVKQVKLGREIIACLIEKKVYIYRFSDLTLLDHLETCSNPKGLCALSADTQDSRTVLAAPASQKGKVMVIFFDQSKIQGVASGLDTSGVAQVTGSSDKDKADKSDSSSSKDKDANLSQSALPNCREKSTLINAHESGVAMLSLNFDGSILATASDKGTLIRLFHTETGSLLQELRRGVDRADVQCISFSANSQWIVLSSDKGTVHVYGISVTTSSSSQNGGGGGPGGGGSQQMFIDGAPDRNSLAAAKGGPGSSSASSADPFGLLGVSNDASNSGLGSNNPNGNPNTPGTTLNLVSNSSDINKRSHFSSIGGALGLSSYFQSEWSFAQFRVPDCRCIVSFGSDPNTVIICCASGAYFKCRFDPRVGGEMIREDYKTFSNSEEFGGDE